MPDTIHAAGTRRGILLVSVSAFFWGTVGISTQAIFHQAEISAITVGFYRLAIAFPALALVAWFAIGRAGFNIRAPHLLRMTLIGGMLAGYQVFYFSAIGYVGVSIATLVTLCTSPVLVALASAVFLKERLNRWAWASLASALAGTACLVGFPQGQSEQTQLLVGCALALGSAAGYAAVTLLGKSLGGRYHPALSAAVSFGAGGLALLPLADLGSMGASYPQEVWAGLLYIGLVPSALAYLLFFCGIRYIPATSASILTLIEPLTATVLAWLIFDERLGSLGLLGAVLLFAAIWLLYRSGRGGGQPGGRDAFPMRDEDDPGGAGRGSRSVGERTRKGKRLSKING
ncbi:membrane protein [Desulfuromonas versatilis]|uniref:Membrane protein n=1 Tax=Desulfuromonas versatilis TaxID=2802975 RepID=A0ABN6DWN4_9BACT|nr:EamA family transporter [Desulfuromonas versatilis]BCR04538.1 membrane protein [Desulfuromonas versatilis]